ncbi:unnamed protein product [Periconia digitata]|uniref:Zn(2)-C6 fungal-type domain-containing protein n=1 Tax=Periconia digitata TaxID=1303443 RepID=A0A9W4XP09_9PLEO|nr:unnamed protein product [Periconia digitata]
MPVHNQRPLLPATQRPPPSPPPAVAQKRRRVTVACKACRTKKLRCSGEQPICARCTDLSQPCEYPVDGGNNNRQVALKRQYSQIESERDQLRDLYNLIRTLPDPEAQEIFRRLRTSADPLQVLQAVKDANTLLRNPDSTSPIVAHLQVHHIDVQALRLSAMRLRGRPWTRVAGDGLVSSLISS